MLKFVKPILIFFISIFLDRWTKYLVVCNILKSQTVTQYFNILVTVNHGISWGIGSDFAMLYSTIFFTIIALILAYFVFFMTKVWHKPNMAISCMLVLAGGISNFVDRLLYGGVIDFIQLHYQNSFFPVFNIADVSITIGAMILIYELWRDGSLR